MTQSINLAESIKNYYINNFTLLPPKEKFHFSSRMTLWTKEKEYLELIPKDFLKERFGDTEKEFIAIITEILNSEDKKEKNNSSEIDKLRIEYQKMFKYLTVLFRIHFSKTLFNINYIKIGEDILDFNKIKEIYQKVINDPMGIAFMSTGTINFIYLYNSLFANRQVDIEGVIKKAKTVYDLTNPLHIPSYFYLLTHIIINESGFYSRNFNKEFLPLGKKLIIEMEEIIKNYFEKIKLDNKIEFLVCANMLEQEIDIKSKIINECLNSISQDGMFLVDTLNFFKDKSIKTLSGSEHRNVLFIMSQVEGRRFVM